MADVIACRVNSRDDEHVVLKQIDGSPLSIALYVDQQLREVFVLSDERHKLWWIHYLRQNLHVVSSSLSNVHNDQEKQAVSPTKTLDQKQEQEQEREQERNEANDATDEGGDDGEGPYSMDTMVIHERPNRYSGSSDDDDEENNDHDDNDDDDKNGSYSMDTMVIHDRPSSSSSSRHEYVSETMVIHDRPRSRGGGDGDDGDGDGDEEGDGDYNYGTMVIHGEDSDGEEYQDGSMRIYGTRHGSGGGGGGDSGIWEEPNLFGKSRNNIFQSSFWNEPETVSGGGGGGKDNSNGDYHGGGGTVGYGSSSSSSGTVTFTKDDFYGAVEEMRERMAELESECLSLRIQLGNKDEVIEKLQLENQRLKAQLGI